VQASANYRTIVVREYQKIAKHRLGRFIGAFESAEADFDSFNSCHVPTRFTCESSLRLNRLRKLDFL
jgi:hypothetical protein